MFDRAKTERGNEVLTIQISSAVRFFCLVTIAAIALSPANAGVAGTGYAMGFLALIYLFSSKKVIERQPLNLLLSIALIFYFGLRLWDLYVFDPADVQSFFSVGLYVHFTAAGRAMGYGTACTAAMYLGLAAGQRPASAMAGEATFQPYRLDVDKSAAFKLFLMFFAAETYFNNSTYMDMTGQNASIFARIDGYIGNHEVLLAIAAMIFAYSRGVNRMQWYILLAALLVVRFVGGARSGIVDIAEILLAWAIIPGNWSGSFKLTWRSGIVTLLIVVGSIASFLAVTAIRSTYFGGEAAAVVEKTGVTMDTWQLVSLVYHQISYRVGTNLDALILVFSSYYDTAYANAHVNLSTTWQTSMNSLFHVGMGPGYMNPQFELAHLLGVRGDQSGHDVMTGYSWGIFAYTYQLFGYWGAVVTGLMFYLFGKSFTALMKHPPSLTRDLLMFAVAHFMELFLTTFGLENMFARYERIAVTIVVAVYLMRRLPKAKDAGTSIRGREIPLLS